MKRLRFAGSSSEEDLVLIPRRYFDLLVKHSALAHEDIDHIAEIVRDFDPPDSKPGRPSRTDGRSHLPERRPTLDEELADAVERALEDAASERPSAERRRLLPPRPANGRPR